MLILARGSIRRSNKGPVPCHVKLLDGSVMQLFAEPNTTGQNFLDQSASEFVLCIILNICSEMYLTIIYIYSEINIHLSMIIS